MAVDEKVRTESSISCQLSDVPKAKENIPLNDSPNPKEVFEQIHKKDCINIKNNLTNILSSASDSNFINKISSNTVFNSHGELPFSKNQTAKPQPLTKFYIGDDNCIHNSKQSLPDEKNNNVLKNNTNIVLTTLDDNRRKDEKLASIPKFVPPDGGYGWIIVFSSCLINTLIIGFLKSYGILYVDIVRIFPNATAYQFSWIPVFLGTFGLLISPITSIMCRQFTSRKVSFIGGFLIFLGLLFGAFAKSVTQLICTFALFTGVGYGFTSTPGLLIVSLYFEKRRALASALCASGNALGGIVFPPLLEYLINAYGFHGAMLITAALLLNICCLSMLFRPINIHALIQEKKKLKKQNKEEASYPLVKSEIEESLLKNESIFSNLHRIKRRMSKKSQSITTNDEVHRQLSFIRSSSMLSSIPDLTRYARSWSLCNNPTSTINCQASSTRLSIKSNNASIPNFNSFVSNPSQIELEKGSTNWFNSSEGLRTIKKSSFSSVQSLPFQNNRISCKRNKEAQPLAPLSECNCGHYYCIERNDKEFKEFLWNEEMKNQKSVQDFKEKSHIQDANIENQLEETDMKKNSNYLMLKDLFDFSLMKNPTFLVLNASTFLFIVGNPHVLFFLPAFANNINIDNSRVVSLLSLSAIIDFIGRLFIGFFADLNLIKASTIYIICASIGAIAVLLIPICTSYVELAIVLGLYGFGVGSWFVMIPTVLIENHGPSKLASSYGLIRMFHGLMNFCAPQILGLLFDATKSYEVLYYFMGTTMLLSTLIFLLHALKHCIFDSRVNASFYISDEEADV